jgi:RNA polymerase sigma-70 factor, ECF subfamily
VRYAAGTMDDPRSDHDLLAAGARGDPGAFAALYRRHRDFVHRVAWRYARDDAEAADAVQDVFVGLLRAAGGVRRETRLTTYLYAAARNAVITRRRRERAGTVDLDHAGAAPARERIPESLGPALAGALAGLPEGHREVLLMRAVDGMSTEEIAAALGIPGGTVKSRLHNTLERLRADPRLRDLMPD